MRVRPAHVASVRRVVRGSLLGSQRSIHFVDERAGRRRQLLDLFCGLPIEAVAYRTVPAPTRREPEARSALLDDIVGIVGGGATRLVIEGRAGRDQLDRRVIRSGSDWSRIQAPRSPTSTCCRSKTRFSWVADAFARVAGAGGEWPDRCGNVLGIVDIEP